LAHHEKWIEGISCSHSKAVCSQLNGVSVNKHLKHLAGAIALVVAGTAAAETNDAAVTRRRPRNGMRW
jgi:hypothetical protein